MNKINVLAMPQADYFVQSEIDRLRVNVGFAGTDKKVIMVTSSVPNEGKSYIAISLWNELAKAGNRVCLVDCDMRKSDLRNTLRLATANNEQFVGLSHYLAGYAEANDVVYATNIERAYLVPTLTMINPSLLLEGNKFDKLISLLKNNFDYVILDTPPLRIVSDGKMISAKCDGCVLVVRAHETSRVDVKNCMQQLAAVGCPLLGIVLNRVENRKTRGYYAKSYYSKGYYTKYYTSSDAEESPEDGNKTQTRASKKREKPKRDKHEEKPEAVKEDE